MDANWNQSNLMGTNRIIWKLMGCTWLPEQRTHTACSGIMFPLNECPRRINVLGGFWFGRGTLNPKSPEQYIRAAGTDFIARTWLGNIWIMQKGAIFLFGYSLSKTWSPYIPMLIVSSDYLTQKGYLIHKWILNSLWNVSFINDIGRLWSVGIFG